MSKTTEKVKAGLAKRYARERHFRAYGIAPITVSMVFLTVFLLMAYRHLPKPTFNLRLI